MLEPVQMQWTGRPGRGVAGHVVEGLREMRRTRIEKRRRSVRVRRYDDEARSFRDALDPRDPDIARAKALRFAERDGAACR